MEADIPDYDMDSDDELWVNSQSPKLELTADKVLYCFTFYLSLHFYISLHHCFTFYLSSSFCNN